MSAVPSVSVVVPTFGRPGPLLRCIEALRAGRRRPDAIWVCAQGTDGYTSPVPLPDDVRCLHLTRPNASAARNAGLRAADTDLVAFIDDDCVCDADWLAALADAFARAPAGTRVAAVSGQIVPMPGTRGAPLSSRTGTVPRVFSAGEGALDAARWAPWDAGSGGNLLVDRGLALSVGGWDPDLGPGTAVHAGEDIDFLYRLARCGDLVFTPSARVYHPRASRRRRVASRYRYGAGMGAALAKHRAAGDPAARRLISLYVRHQGASATRGAWGPLEAVLTLAGFSRGFLRGRTTGG